MILAFSVAAAVLFGTGAYLLLRSDLVRVVAGIMLISQAALVTIIGAGLTRGPAAIAVPPGGATSDPLPQALALTALVIGLATVALLLALVHRVVMEYRTAERAELAASEEEHEADVDEHRPAEIPESS